MDLAVVEVGLGGRLDATNILHPRLCLITNIALEHTDILGEALEAIAWEKAGIVKPARFANRSISLGISTLSTTVAPAPAKSLIILSNTRDTFLKSSDSGSEPIPIDCLITPMRDPLRPSL